MSKSFNSQLIPIILSAITCASLIGVLYVVIHVLNMLPTRGKIIPIFRFADIAVGLTIYLKTSIDFALFIGNLMRKNIGIRNRIAIEIGTALGNGIGTMLIIIVWTFFKEIPLLLVLMITLAALVLLKLAEDGLHEFFSESHTPLYMQKLFIPLISILHIVNKATEPITQIILPVSGYAKDSSRPFLKLLFFSFSIPFILGLDDFAGYIPLFSIINIFGFAIGILIGHMLLNIALFAFPTKTTTIVRLPIVMIVGSLAFIAIALWGFSDVAHILLLFFSK